MGRIRWSRMGQKVNPVGFRISMNNGWQSRWFASRDYSKLIKEDSIIRSMIQEQLGNAGISKIEIERTEEEVKVDMYTSKPGIVIGRRGATINDIRDSIEKKIGNIIQLNIIEVKKPELIAKLVAEGIASQLEGRVSFRKAMKKAVSLSMKAGAKGVRIQCSGRLGGAEMARREWYREGRVPLHTLRANIDYGFAEANTTFGKIGVKVWIYAGDLILDEEDMNKNKQISKENTEKRNKLGDTNGSDVNT
jgi:small subunit ribosomal protein S3